MSLTEKTDTRDSDEKVVEFLPDCNKFLHMILIIFSGKAKSKNAQRGKTGAAKNFAGRFELNTEIIFFWIFARNKSTSFPGTKANILSV